MPEKVIIIGSGPSGLTATIYAARANLRPVLFEGFQSGGIPGGQLMITTVVENFPGFPKGVEGPALMQNMRDQALEHGASLITEDVESVDLSSRPFKVTSSSGAVFEALSLIIATGATAKRLPLESERRFWGKGISACAVCDGGLPVFRNKPLAVIGGGDSALEEAMHLTQFASKVYIIHRRDQFRASKVMQERAIKHPKIEVLWNRTIKEFVGSAMVSSLILEDTKSGATSTLEIAGVFEAIGHQPNTGFLKGQLALDDDGYIVVTPGRTMTSVEGVFASGDVTDKTYRQAITAAGRGCMAAIDAERWLQSQGMI